MDSGKVNGLVAIPEILPTIMFAHMSFLFTYMFLIQFNLLKISRLIRFGQSRSYKASENSRPEFSFLMDVGCLDAEGR